MINQSILEAHLWAVDRCINRTYLQDVKEGVDAYLRSLIAKGAILGGKCWVDPEQNTPADIAAGKVTFDFDFVTLTVTLNNNVLHVVANNKLEVVTT